MMTDMKLGEYRSNEDLVRSARKVLESKPMQQMLRVLENEAPSTRPLPVVGTDDNAFKYAYGADIGHRQCIAMLKVMATPIPSQNEVSSTFAESNNG